MAERLLGLMRVDIRAGGTPVLVNLRNVAWIEPDEKGATRVVFAVGLHYERANGPPLSILVRESPEEIARLAGRPGTADEEAIGQAWAERSERRRREGDDADASSSPHLLEDQ
jgi:hypothetical protein